MADKALSILVLARFLNPLSNPLTPTAPGEGPEKPIPELQRLGEQLAQARQTAGISVEALTQRLRLAPSQLKALEAGDHTRLPEGVFVVALARRVAGALHADVDDALQAVRQSRLMSRPSVPAPRPASGEGVAMAPTHAAPSSPAPTAPAASAPAPTPQAPQAIEPRHADPLRTADAPQPGPLPPNPRDTGWGEVSPGPTGPRRWPLAALAALLAAGGLATAWLVFPRPSPRGVSSAPASGPTPATTALHSPTRLPSGSTAPAPAPAAGDSLLLQTSEPSWVQVRDLEGRTLFEGTFTGDKRFPIGRGVEVIAGRPHAVRAAMGAAPAAPLGGVADIRWKRFSPAGLQPDSLASPAPTR